MVRHEDARQDVRRLGRGLAHRFFDRAGRQRFEIEPTELREQVDGDFNGHQLREAGQVVMGQVSARPPHAVSVGRPAWFARRSHDPMTRAAVRRPRGPRQLTQPSEASPVSAAGLPTECATPRTPRQRRQLKQANVERPPCAKRTSARARPGQGIPSLS